MDTTEIPRKDDSGKLDWTLLMQSVPHCLERVVAVQHWAVHVKENPYPADNWKLVERKRYVAALFRHLMADMKGDKTDPETGQPHLAHAICCLLFMMHKDLEAQDGADNH